MKLKATTLVLMLSISLLSAQQLYAQTALPQTNNTMPHVPAYPSLAQAFAANHAAKPADPVLTMADFLKLDFHAPANFILQRISMDTTEISTNEKITLYRKVGAAIGKANHVTLELQKMADLDIVSTIFANDITITGEVETTVKIGGELVHRLVEKTEVLKSFVDMIQTHVKAFNLNVDAQHLNKKDIQSFVAVVQATEHKTKSDTTIVFSHVDGKKLADVVKAASSQITDTDEAKSMHGAFEITVRGNPQAVSGNDLKSIMLLKDKGNKPLAVTFQAPDGKSLMKVSVNVLSLNEKGVESVETAHVVTTPSPTLHKVDMGSVERPHFQVDYYRFDSSNGNYVWKQQTTAKGIKDVKDILAKNGDTDKLTQEVMIKDDHTKSGQKDLDVAITIKSQPIDKKA